MKPNSSVFAILLTLCAIGLSAQNQNLEFYIYNSSKIRLIENQLQYQLTPIKNGLVSISGASSQENRLNFNQNTKNAKLGMNFSYRYKRLQQALLTGYEYHYDQNDLALDTAKYQSRLGFLGYQAEYSPLDSLVLELVSKGYFRSEEDPYTPRNVIRSDGISLASAIRFSASQSFGDYGLRAGIEYKNLDWEYYNYHRLDAWYQYSGFTSQVSTNLSFDDRSDRLYSLVLAPNPEEGGSYQQNDTQQRRQLYWNTNLNFNPAAKLRLALNNNFMQRRTDLKENITRNNSDFLNQAGLSAEYDLLPRLMLQTKIMHNYASKDFSYTNSTRLSEFRSLETLIKWEYSHLDSLTLGGNIDLQRTLYPDSEHKLDNDLRHVNLKAGWKHYFKDRIRLAGWLLWVLTDDVYIDSLLSSNNNQINSVSLLPEISIVLGDKILFRQNYQIRADYTDYIYKTEERVNGLYRQLGGKYSLVYDSYPLLARSGDSRWISLPYRPSGENAFSIELSMAYERSEYGQQLGNQYVMNTPNERYTASCAIRHDISSLYYLIQPKFSWGSWKEYNLLLGLAWNFDNNSQLEFTLSPLGDSLSELDWRTTLNLNLQF